MTSAYKKRAKGGWNGDKAVSNRKERSYEDHEIKEQLEEVSGKTRKAVKKSNQNKDIARTLGTLRFIYKLSHGDVESLNKKQEYGGSCFESIRQEYYQKYRELLPEVIELLERDDLPAKIRRQVIEVLQLYGITR